MTFIEQESYINEVIRELKNINESLAILVKNQSCQHTTGLKIRIVGKLEKELYGTDALVAENVLTGELTPV